MEKSILLYKMVQEGLSGGVTPEQKLGWDHGANPEAARKSVPTKEGARCVREQPGGQCSWRGVTPGQGREKEREIGQVPQHTFLSRPWSGFGNLVLKALWEVRGMFYPRSAIN